MPRAQVIEGPDAQFLNAAAILEFETKSSIIFISLYLSLAP